MLTQDVDNIQKVNLLFTPFPEKEDELNFLQQPRLALLLSIYKGMYMPI